jgi:hypothetical protein
VATPAFWTLMFMAPFASWSEERANVASGLAAGSVVVTLLTVVTLGPWTALVAGRSDAGRAPASRLVRTSSRPRLPCRPTPWRSPQINFSSTDIAGNIGGLIFVVGSVLIVSLALPSDLLVPGWLAASLRVSSPGGSPRGTRGHDGRTGHAPDDHRRLLL